jgi:hypothetical protein
MQDPVPPDLHTRIRQAFLLGLARQPVAPPRALAAALPPASESGIEPALALLALAGQRQRFAGPTPVAPAAVADAARILHADPRPILPGDARRALRHLAGSVEKSLAGDALRIALRRVSASGCRPHPFDLPDLARHIKDDAENLGLAERAYLALVAPDTDEDAAKGLFFDRITDENWTTFPKKQRRMFVAEARHRDPAQGRALIESVWKAEPAPVRAALLEALAVGLGADDKPFLEKLATDRADSVKQVALRLMARMPATENFDQRVAEAAKCFRRTSGAAGRMMAALGIGGEGTLTFTMPAADPSRWQEAHAERERLFSGLPLEALARAVGATPAELVAALPEAEHHVRTLMLDSAVQEDDTAMVQSIVTARLMSSPDLPGLAVRMIAVEARRPIDTDAASRFLASPAWKKKVSGSVSTIPGIVPREDGGFIFTAALMPREAMPAFAASLEPLAAITARAARDFADLILALPADRNASPEHTP